MGEGKRVRKVLVAEASSVRKELYLSLVVDQSRGKECVVFTALERAGVVIEKNPAEIGRRVQEILKAHNALSREAEKVSCFLCLTKPWFLVSQIPVSCLTGAMRVRNGSRCFMQILVLSKFDTMQGGVCLSGFFTVSAV
jgi:hypothetical protein